MQDYLSVIAFFIGIFLFFYFLTQDDVKIPQEEITVKLDATQIIDNE